MFLLVAAQSELVNPQPLERPWQQVAVLEINPDRITALHLAGRP